MAVSRSRDEDQQLGSTLDSRLHHGRDPTIHAVRHPPIELAGLRPRDRLHPDRRIDFLAICFGSGRSTHGVGALGLLQPHQEVRTELDRWFFSVAGSVDAITAGVLLALARRLRRPHWFSNWQCGHCGRRDHPSLPANIRCHPRNRRGAADRLLVLA